MHLSLQDHELQHPLARTAGDLLASCYVQYMCRATLLHAEPPHHLCQYALVVGCPDLETWDMLILEEEPDRASTT